VAFDYSLSNSGPVTIQQGVSGTVTNIGRSSGSESEPVSLSCVSSSLPTGITCGSFTLNPVTPTGSSGLTVNVASSVAAGPHSFMVTGSPLVATTTPSTVAVTVTAIPPAFDYSLSNSGPVTIQQGVSGTVTITATLSAGTAQPVTLSCVSSSLPTGITCGSFTLNPVTPTGSSGLTVNVASSVAAGPHRFMVTGSPLRATTTPTTVAVTVTAIPPAFDYSLSNSGPVTIQQGVSGTVTITATLSAGTAPLFPFSSLFRSLPTGITCGSFTLNPVTPTGSSGLTVNVASSVAAG